MSRLWKIAAHEYRRHALQRRFILVLLSIPLLVGLLVLLVMVVVYMENDARPLGYVDQAGILDPSLPRSEHSFLEPTVEMVAYNNREAAQMDLDLGAIQGFYVLPSDFLETNRAELVYTGDIGENATDQFDEFLKLSLLVGQPPEVVVRVIEGPNVTVRTPDGSRQFSEDSFADVILLFIAGFLFMMLIFISNGYLIGVVADEKENRTMEILVTSVSPGQLVTGKVLGIFAVVLTQVVVWLGVLLAAVYLGGNYYGIKWLKNLSIDPAVLVSMIAIFIPAYLMYAAFITAIGAIVSATSEGQQIAGTFSLPLAFSYWFLPGLLENPNSPLAVGLSLFPLSAPMALPLRIGLTVVPPWQFAVGIGGLVIFAFLGLWLSGRALRLGLLRYGKRLSIRELFTRAG